MNGAASATHVPSRLHVDLPPRLHTPDLSLWGGHGSGPNSQWSPLAQSIPMKPPHCSPAPAPVSRGATGAQDPPGAVDTEGDTRGDGAGSEEVHALAVSAPPSQQRPTVPERQPIAEQLSPLPLAAITRNRHDKPTDC